MTTADKLEWPQGTPLFELAFRTVSEGMNGVGVLASGDMEVTATGNTNEISVAAGDLWVPDTTYSLGSAETHVLSDNTSGSDRWDTVVLDTGTGSSTVKKGTAEADPEPPGLASGEILLAYIYVPDGATDTPDSRIYNWRALSTDAADVRLNDSAGDYSAANVEAALTEVVRNLLGTDIGSYGNIIDAEVTSSPGQGTEQSYGLSLDATTLLLLYTEADGNGGIQNPELRLPNSPLRIGTPGDTGYYPIESLRTDSGGIDYKLEYSIFTNGDGVLGLYDQTNGNKISQLRLKNYGAVEIQDDLELASGETVVDYSNKRVPTSIVQTIALGSDTDRNLSGNDLNDNSGPGTLYNATAGEFPRGVLDDEATATTVTSSTYTTSDEEVLFVDTAAIGSSSTITVASADIEDGHRVVVADISGSASGYPITVETEGAENINGGSSYTISTDYAGATFSADGSKLVTTSPAPLEPIKQVEGAESGAVANGEQGTLIFDHLQDGETLEIYKGIFTLDDGTPAPTDLDLIIATLDNSGSYTVRATIHAGDGATVWDGDPTNSIGDPLASYQNTSGGGQTVAVLADNATGSSQSIMAKMTGERVP